MTADPSPSLVFTEPLEGEVLPPAPDEVTEYCDQPGCDWQVTGPAGGKGSAPMQAGKHRWSVHRVRKDGTQSPTKGRGGKAVNPETLIDGGHPVADTVAAIGSQVTGTGAPRAEQLARALGVGLSAVTHGAARWAVRTDPGFQAAVAAAPEEGAARQRDLVAALGLSPEAAAKVLAPVARILAPTQLNRKFGRAVVENTDIGPAITELSDVAGVWVQYLAVRRASVLEARAVRAAEAAAFAPVVVPMPEPMPPMPEAPTVPGPIGSGFVATAAH